MQTTLRALADPRRLEILRITRTDEVTAADIAARFDVTRPAISQHLRILTEAGLLCVRREGTRRLYRARPEGLAELKSLLEGYWADRLDDLRQEAEAEERGSGDLQRGRGSFVG